ncbi:MAG: hypothetical protein J6T74_00765, partial [Clostridia bacterium]|nr:hypothetical protein [Clostridia bacterium]
NKGNNKWIDNNEIKNTAKQKANSWKKKLKQIHKQRKGLYRKCRSATTCKGRFYGKIAKN